VDNADVQPWRIFWSLYRQQDGTIELPIGGTVRMDDAKALKALTFMRKLTAEGLATVGVDYAGAVATFTEKRAGIHWNGDWEVATFTTAKLPFSMTGFPALYGNGRAEADSHSFVLPRQRDRDPAATRATYTFLAYLLKNSVTWGQAGHIPAYQPVAISPQYLALKPQSEYRDVVKDIQLDPPAWFSGSGSELEIQAGVAFQAVFTGALTPEQGLAQFKGALNRLLTTPSPA
jgi:multiple sugar transport system substrate-binding protein